MTKKMIAADDWIQIILPLIEEGHSFKIEPNGMSMFPFLISDRDSAVLEKADVNNLKALDIVLYRRRNSTFVLHRIVCKKSGNYDIVGDNEVYIEHNVQPEQIVAKATSIVRNGKEISCNNKKYRMLSRIWLWLRPCRPIIVRIRGKIYKKWRI